jgi:hypothetical protein
MTKLFLFIFSLAAILTACSDNKVEYPFDYLQTKTELDNEMLLYSCGDNPNSDTLAMFCRDKKKEFSSGLFHYVVFFDEKNNATFPNNPLTALHNDEEQLKHIKAVYTFNQQNGYSKLATYKVNAFESISNEIDIK